MPWTPSDVARFDQPGRSPKLRRQAPLLATVSVAAFIATIAVMLSERPSRADEGGVSFWLPGLFGSLAAVPAQPGFSFGNIVYHTSVSASGEVAAARQITIGRLSPTVNVNLNAKLDASIPADFMNVNYVFASPVLGGQLAAGMAAAFGRPVATLSGTLTASVGDLAVTRSGSITDSRWAVSDLYPLVSLRWNHGVHNFMIYGMGDIPVGSYDPSRLANLGIGHGAADGGFGYTYFNPATGHEFSAVTGVTYNLRNTQTDYQNGIDWHLDWGLSKFVTPQVQIGAVGYFYQQLTPDTGQSPILGEFKSRVIGVGPQFGYLFPVAGLQGYLNAKAYFEFAAENRPEGFNVWLTFVISPAAQHAAAPKPLVRKY
jgi:hypothetical protein